MGRARAKRTVVQQLLNPPFNRTFAELSALTDDQLLFLYDVDRGHDGIMLITLPPTPSPTLKELHGRKCFLLGITSAAKVAKLWAEEQAKRAAREAQRQPGRRRPA